jgi:hypothetical protein
MIEMTSLVAIVIALTQLVKDLGIPPKFAPVISLLLGITGSLFFLEGDVQYRIMSGILMGLAASGLYDVGKIPTRIGSKNTIIK